MKLVVSESQLIYDCCHMERVSFYRIYASWFVTWPQEISNSLYKRVREYVVQNEVFIDTTLKKSRRNRYDNKRFRELPKYKSFPI